MPDCNDWPSVPGSASVDGRITLDAKEVEKIELPEGERICDSKRTQEELDKYCVGNIPKAVRTKLDGLCAALPAETNETKKKQISCCVKKNGKACADVELDEEEQEVEGSEVKKLAKLVGPCWSRAQFGDYTDCGTRPADSAAGKEILAKFKEYSTARIRPISYRFEEAALENDDFGKCGSGWRAPTKSEVARLWTALELNPDIPTASDTANMLETGTGAWYADSGECEAAEVAWIERLPNGEFADGCYAGGWLTDDMELVTFCVPKSGIYGANVPKLPGT